MAAEAGSINAWARTMSDEEEEAEGLLSCRLSLSLVLRVVVCIFLIVSVCTKLYMYLFSWLFLDSGVG